MTKAYYVVTYHSISDPERLARYAELAGPAMAAGGARFITRGMPALVYEAGKNERTVVAEFPSVEAAEQTYNSEAYKKALDALGDAAVRDIRICPAC